MGREGAETGGEAVEMRAVSLVCLLLCLVWFCMVFLINWAAPFSTSLCDCRTIVEKKMFFSIYKKKLSNAVILVPTIFFTSV